MNPFLLDCVIILYPLRLELICITNLSQCHKSCENSRTEERTKKMKIFGICTQNPEKRDPKISFMFQHCFKS